MQLTLARHPITDIRFGTSTCLDGSVLVVDEKALREIVLQDASLAGVDFAIARPGESCRAGPIFDVVEPRAKEPGIGSDFPGIIGAPTTAGIGTTRVLTGAAVSVLGEMRPDPTRPATGRLLEMSGRAAEGSHYSTLQHLVSITAHEAGPRAPSDFESLPYRRRQSCDLSRPSGARPHASVAAYFRSHRAVRAGTRRITAGRLHRPDLFASTPARG